MAPSGTIPCGSETVSVAAVNGVGDIDAENVYITYPPFAPADSNSQSPTKLHEHLKWTSSQNSDCPVVMMSVSGSKSSSTKIYEIASTMEFPINAILVPKNPVAGCNIFAYGGGYTNGLAYGG